LKDNKLAANDSLNWINTDVISLLKTMWLKWVTNWCHRQRK